jgi:SRSO17 transposase
LDVSELSRVHESFREFHARSPLFGRREPRNLSRLYLQSLLRGPIQRRNAENLSEEAGVSARSLQRFLTIAPWDHDRVIGSLQEYLGPRLDHPYAVWVLDGSDFPRKGDRSAGLKRRWCGATGKIDNCQAGMFLGFTSPRGRAVIDKRLYPPREWTDYPGRCAGAGIPGPLRAYRSKTRLGLEMLQAASGRGALRSGWVATDDVFGSSPAFRGGVASMGLHYVLDVPESFSLWPRDPVWLEPPPYEGRGRPRKSRSAPGQKFRIRDLPEGPRPVWRRIAIPPGAKGERSYRYLARRLRISEDRRPGTECTAICRTNLDGSEPRYLISNAPEGTSPARLARAAASRWSIETEFETLKRDVGMDEYEVRSFSGWHHHMAMCLMAGAFLLTLRQDWGKNTARQLTRPRGLSDSARAAAPARI